MDFAEQLCVLEAAHGHPAKLALATVDLAYPELPDAVRVALRSSLEAAAIPHWCDESILSALLEIPKQESAVRLDRLCSLSVVEPFPARGGNAVNVHEATRLALRKRMVADDQARFRILGARAMACFADDPTPAGQIEWIYHLLCCDPERGASELKKLGRDWSRSARPEDRYALETALRELEDTRLVQERARIWVLLVTAWTRVSRGETAQLADVAGNTLDLARAAADPRAEADAQALLGEVLEAQGKLREALGAYEEALAINRRLAEQDPSNADLQWELSVAHNRVGEVLEAQAKLRGVEAAYGEDLAISRRLVEHDPSNAGRQDIYAAVGNNTVQQFYASPETSFPVGKPFQVTPLPRHFVPRPEVIEPLRSSLLTTPRSGILAISALHGLGGIGKTILAQALTYDAEIQACFVDGVLWATLTQEPDVLSELKKWIDAVIRYSVGAVNPWFDPPSVDAAVSYLRSLLMDKTFLLVVDDAWELAHVEPFWQAASPTCQLLITTRRAQVAEELQADLYRLDVMTPAHCLTLLSKHLNRQLQGAEEAQALQLAETVGYLPLALILVAARIRHGVPWPALNNALREEIARLKVLDCALDQLAGGEPKLAALLNLSLEALRVRTPEGEELWRAFLWLGVLPEDSQFSAPMAATLWQMSTEKALLVLEVLNDEALLMPASDVLAGERQWPAYRLHDLMHDIARHRLLDTSANGLGIPSLVQANATLLERYRARTREGLWHILDDDGYIHSHLTWHMQRAEQAAEIHRLLQEETADGLNGWYQARERLGQTAGYLADVHRAWRAAERANLVATAAGDVAPHLGSEVRCALYQTSMNSMAANIPPALLHVLLEFKEWTVAQVLAYARQIPDSHSRMKALGEVATHLQAKEPLRTEVLAEALAAARAIESERSRALTLSTLAPNLPETKRAEVLQEALVAARAIADKKSRADVLNALAPHLPEAKRAEVLAEALATARAIEYDPYDEESPKARALSALAPRLPEALLTEALAAARAIEDPDSQVEVLNALAPHLPKPLLAEALAAAQAVEYEMARAQALSALAPHLPEPLLAEALAAARAIEDPESQVKALGALAPHLPEVKRAEVLSEALATAWAIEENWSRAFAVRALAPQLPEVLAMVLAADRAIEDEKSRAQALSALAPDLPVAKRADVLSEALTAARSIEDEWSRAQALSALAPHLPEAKRGVVLAEALAATRAIKDEKSRAQALSGLAPQLPQALSALAPHLPQALLADVIAAARSIAGEESRVKVLNALAPYLPEAIRAELLAEVLAATRAIKDEGSRAQALSALAPHLPQALLADVIAAARSIKYEGSRAWVLSALAPHLPQALLAEVLAAARAIKYEGSRARLLCALAPHLPQALLAEVLAAARVIKYDSSRADVLSALAPHLPEALLAEALAAARAIESEWSRADALSALAPHLPEALLVEALAAAQAIEYEKSRAEVLRALAPYLPEAKRGEVLSEALAAARAIEDEKSRAEMLRALVPHLPEALLAEALAAARAIEDEESQVEVLNALAPHLPEALLAEALAAAQAIEYERYRARVLSALAPHLPEALLVEALAVGRAIEDRWYRVEEPGAEVRRVLGKHLPGPLRGEMVTRAPARFIGYERDQGETPRALALSALAPHLPEPKRGGVLAEALAAARTIEDGEDRALLLRALAPHMPEPKRVGVLTEALAAARTIEDNKSRVEVLSALAPHLPEALLAEALAVAQAIEDERNREKALTALALHLAKLPIAMLYPSWRETLNMSANRFRSDLFVDLDAMRPIIVTLGGEKAMVEAFRAIQDVARWWP